MHADLQDSDDGQQGDEEPKPAGGEPGAAGALVPREERECGEQGDGAENDQQGPGAGMRIENSEIGGPEKFSDVADAGDGGVGETGGERQREGERAEARLHQDCHYRNDRRQREERDFFDEQRTPAVDEGAEASVGRRGGGEALQRPEVEEQENERQRNDHRFAHQAEEEECERERVAAERADALATAVGVGGVGPEREQEEAAAHDVLAFGDPDDGFDAERMPGKERGGEDGGPIGAGEAAENEEDEDGVERVPEDARQVMSESDLVVELPIEHVGEPGERMPVIGVAGEGPDDARPGEAGADVGVVGDVARVVVVEKPVVERAAEKENGAGEQERADKEREQRRADVERTGGHRGGLRARGKCAAMFLVAEERGEGTAPP